MTPDPRAILINCAEQALKHLADPAADVETIARQMGQTARLVLTGQSPNPGKPSADELAERYAGLASTARKVSPPNTKPPPSGEEVAEYNRLRPTHTLKQLAAKFGRNLQVIAEHCTVVADFRGKHMRRSA